MADLNTKDFIRAVFIDDLDGIMAIDKPYLCFIIMANGIEFLGRCINSSQNWEEDKVSSARFREAIENMPSLTKYRQYLSGNGSYDLYGSLRCGLSHSAKPDYEITLSSKDEAPHLQINAGRLNIKCEDFHVDFKDACNHVIRKHFPAADKMNQPFLHVPDAVPAPATVAVAIPSGLHIGPISRINSSGSTR